MGHGGAGGQQHLKLWLLSCKVGDVGTIRSGSWGLCRWPQMPRAVVVSPRPRVFDAHAFIPVPLPPSVPQPGHHYAIFHFTPLHPPCHPECHVTPHTPIHPPRTPTPLYSPSMPLQHHPARCPPHAPLNTLRATRVTPMPPSMPALYPPFHHRAPLGTPIHPPFHPQAPLFTLHATLCHPPPPCHFPPPPPPSPGGATPPQNNCLSAHASHPPSDLPMMAARCSRAAPRADVTTLPAYAGRGGVGVASALLRGRAGPGGRVGLWRRRRRRR